MKQAPDDKRPGRAVPEAANEHHDHEVDHSARRTKPVSAQRNVEVIAQESGERDVPPPPKIGEPDGRVGKAEVVLEVKPEAERGADRADGIAGKIKKDLAGKSDHAGPRIEGYQGAAITEDAVSRAREQSIGKHDFFEQAERHQEQSPQEAAFLRFGRGI